MIEDFHQSNDIMSLLVEMVAKCSPHGMSSKALQRWHSVADSTKHTVYGLRLDRFIMVPVISKEPGRIKSPLV